MTLYAVQDSLQPVDDLGNAPANRGECDEIVRALGQAEGHSYQAEVNHYHEPLSFTAAVFMPDS